MILYQCRIEVIPDLVRTVFSDLEKIRGVSRVEKMIIEVSYENPNIDYFVELRVMDDSELQRSIREIKEIRGIALMEPLLNIHIDKLPCKGDGKRCIKSLCPHYTAYDTCDLNIKVQ
ncbi:MAG: hypothetical protein J7J21_06105 [Methanomicrobia archaeon]|nr:hypothetical protein [Methanomicrobia archaeon]